MWEWGGELEEQKENNQNSVPPLVCVNVKLSLLSYSF